MGLGISLLITLPALDGISLYGTELSVLGPTVAGTAGLVGASIIDRILDSDDDDDGDNSGGGGGDELMNDDFGGGMDDDFGGGMDDDFGGGGGGGGNIDELEHQLDELENEVASLSSTVTTVKSENTEISDRIEDVEEDVRNLLDIYEMVTRGINPFVDEQEASDFDVGGGTGGGGLGLFDDGEDEEETSQQDDDGVDDDVMNEDADDFFDDDFEEMDDEFGEELDTEDDATDSEEMVSDQDSTGGKSFSELKDEYDSGDASWADEDDEESMDDGLDMDDSFEDDSMDDGLGMDESFEDDDLEMDDDSFGEMDEPDESLANGSESTTEDAHAPIEDDTQDDFEYVSSDQLSESGDKPYLTAIPGDYVGDLVVMEWLEFLVEESTVTDAARAVNYYERIEWIDEDAADHLRSFLSGFGNIDRNKVSQPGTDQLNRTHHVHSLKYIMKLNNGTTATSVILDRWDSFSGKDNGF